MKSYWIWPEKSSKSSIGRLFGFKLKLLWFHWKGFQLFWWEIKLTSNWRDVSLQKRANIWLNIWKQTLLKSGIYFKPLLIQSSVYLFFSAKDNSAVTEFFHKLIISIERGGHDSESAQDKQNKCVIAWI